MQLYLHSVLHDWQQSIITVTMECIQNLVLTPSIRILSARIQAMSQSISYLWFIMTIMCSRARCLLSSGSMCNTHSHPAHHCPTLVNSDPTKINPMILKSSDLFSRAAARKCSPRCLIPAKWIMANAR